MSVYINRIFSHLESRTSCYFRSVMSVGALAIVLCNTSCQEPSMECLSQFECGGGLTCVAGQCVGVEVEGEPYELYVNEMHARLVNECGICHAAAPESIMPETPVGGSDRLHTIDIDDPFGMPTYTTVTGDSGWRIYINEAPSPAQLLASYRDTLQYLNPQRPEDSLLFVYGRGDQGVSSMLAHPKVYPTQAELEQGMSMSVFGADYVGYQRLINWAGLAHSDPNVINYDLERYRESVQDLLNIRCGGCHNGDPTQPWLIKEGASPEFRGGGFATYLNATNLPESPEDLAPLTSLINLENPANSSLIRLIDGEFDHISLNFADGKAEFTEVIITWIESLREQR